VGGEQALEANAGTERANNQHVRLLTPPKRRVVDAQRAHLAVPA
jgi:hypothetical protein